MSKSKRGKSASLNEAGRWEAELVQTQFNEETWKACIFFLIPYLADDNDLIDILSEVVSTGLRKLFSVITYDALMNDVKELGKGSPPGGGGKGKGAVAVKAPPFHEVCEQVKSLVDQGEVIPPQLMAKLIKFKLLTIKSKDIDRRDEEIKAAKAADAAKNKDEKNKKSGSPSGKRSKSPGKKKGKGKEVDLQPSSKKDSKLKKRGDAEDTFKTIDDEPDDEGSPQHYVLIHGILTSQVIYHLSEIGVHTDAIITIKAETYDKHDDSSLTEKALIEDADDPEAAEKQANEREKQKHELKTRQEIDTFFRESDKIVLDAPSGHKLKDIARYQVIIKDKILPERPLTELDADKKTEFGTAIFGDVADVCYTMLDQWQQYKQYLESMKLIQVPLYTTHATTAMGDTPSNYSVTGPQSAEGVVPVQAEVDSRYYKHLIDGVPTESHSVPLILHCLLEQVRVTVDENNPLDQEPSTRPDGLNAVLATHVSEKISRLALASDEYQDLTINSKEGNSLKNASTKPVILQQGDGVASRSLYLDELNGLSPLQAEFEMLKFFPQNMFFKNLTQTVNGELFKRAACYNELRHFCNSRTVPKQILDRALMQYAFEAMLLKTSNESGHIIHPSEIDETLKYYLNPWDFPYDQLCNFRTDSLTGTISFFRNIDDWCFVENFDKNTLLQVLEDARHTHPYTDTYYCKTDNSLLLVLHNPPGPNFQSSSSWETRLHSNVGFRNYLEHVVDGLKVWLKEKERIKSEVKESPTPPPPVPEQPTVPLKVGSRYGLQTRAEVAALKAEEDDAKNKKGKGKKTPRPGTRSPRRSPTGKRTSTPDVKDKGRSPSGKGSAKGDKRGGRSKSRVGMDEEPIEKEVTEPVIVPEAWDFIGYNVGDNLLHVSGSLTTLFPCDGGQIRIEKNAYIHGASCVRASVLKDGNTFVLHFLEPIDEVLKQEEIDGIEEQIDKEQVIDRGVAEEGGIEEAIEKNETELSEKEETTNEEGQEQTAKCLEPKPFCEFSSLVAHLSDGMILSLTGFGPSGNSQNKQTEQTNSSGFGGGEAVQLATLASSSPQPKAVSPKLRKKQDEEAKKIEELQQQQQQEEERLRQDKAKEEEKLKKPFQQLFVSSPDGLRVEYMNDSLFPSEGDMGGVIVRQGYPVKSPVSRGGEGEIWRTITTNGTVIKLLINGGVEVLFPDGGVSSCKTFPVQPLQPCSKPGSAAGIKVPQDNVTTSLKKGGKGAMGIQTSVEGSIDTIAELGKVPEWLSTGTDGKRILTQSDGTHTTLDNILCSLATCRHTNQVLRMREDNVVMIDHPDSTRVVEHADGTRITTFYQDVQIETREADNETGEEAHYITEQVQFVKVEYAGFATVTFQTNTGACVTTWGNETSMVTQADGSSVITKPDNSRLQIDKKGILSFIPRNVAQDKHFPLPVPLNDGSNVPAGVYVMRSAAQMCCEMTDERGCQFCVVSNGHFTVQKPGDEAKDESKGLNEHYTPPVGLSLDPYNIAKITSNPETPLVPRYFILHSDGTGLELLRGIDVQEFLEEAQQDPRCAILQSPVEGHVGVTGLTILKPYSGGVSKIWKKDKDQANIIPSGLREREFHFIPVTEQKSSGPHFGTNIGLGLNIGPNKRKPSYQSPSITCPTVLELRQFLRYKPLTQQDRQTVTDALQKYGQYVAGRLERSDFLLPQDSREEIEKLAAEELNAEVEERNDKQEGEKAEEKGSCEEEISREFAKETHDFESYEQKYIDFISPVPEPPAPPPKWKRPPHEWECDRIELAELHYGQHALRLKEVPPYFETAQGQAFLKGIYHQDVPDIDSLTAKLAEQTRHPPPEFISRLETPQTQPTVHEVPSFSTENADYLAVEATPSPSAVSATPNNLRPTNPTPAHADGNGTPTSLRPHNPTPGHASKTANLRPTNPTPAKASGEHDFTSVSPLESPQLKENLTSLQEVTTPPLQEPPADSADLCYTEQARLCSSTEANVGAKSLYFDVTGQPRTSKVKLPNSILSGKPGALPNTKFMEVEDPVRRRVQTVSVTGGDQITKEKISGLRGFELLPPNVGFGVLKEGCTYQSTVRLKNTGIDSCRFKVKQPPPSTGLKVLCTPGSVAAGMSVPLTVEIFAVAVGVSGDSGVGQIGHHVEIITETDFLYLPVLATILTVYEYESRYGEEVAGLGPGTIQVTNRPPSRDAIRPRRDESFHVST